MEAGSFEKYCLSKRIDFESFKNNEAGLYKKFQESFLQMHPASFTAQKLYLINDIRRRYPATNNQLEAISNKELPSTEKNKVNAPAPQVKPKVPSSVKTPVTPATKPKILGTASATPRLKPIIPSKQKNNTSEAETTKSNLKIRIPNKSSSANKDVSAGTSSEPKVTNATKQALKPSIPKVQAKQSTSENKAPKSILKPKIPRSKK